MRDIYVLAILASLYPLILASPFVGTQVYAWLGFMVPYNQLWVPLPISWVAMAAGLTIIGWLIGKEPKNVFKTPIIWLLLVYYAWTTLTLQFAWAPGPAWEKWTEFSKVVLMCCLTAVMLTSRNRIHLMVWMLVLAFSFYAMRGTIVTLLAPGMNVIGAPGTPWAGTNGVARAFLMTAPLVYYLAFHSGNQVVRWAMMLLLAFFLLALLGTNSRGGWVAGLVAGGYFIYRSKHYVRLTIGALVLGLLLLAVIPEERLVNATQRFDTIQEHETDTSAQDRFKTWQFAWNIAVTNPVMGAGFDVFTLRLGRDRALAAHSNYFEVLAEHGFPGLFLYLWLVVACWFGCGRIERIGRRHFELYWARDLAIMLRVGLVGYLVGGLFINFAHNPLFYSYIALIGGTLAVTQREAVRLGVVEIKAKRSKRRGAAGHSVPAE